MDNHAPDIGAQHTRGIRHRADQRSRRPGRVATLTQNVAPGVHRLEHAHVNCYLVEADSGRAITLVDAAHPRTWAPLQSALTALGRTPGDVAALVLTHAHFDHLGMARRIRAEWGVPIHGHPEEGYIARHPYRYAHERPRSAYPIRHPRAVPILSAMVAAGAAGVHGVDHLLPLAPGESIDVPGSPSVVFSPGHTYGHCALHLRDRGAVLTGDALVTLDPYTGERGPRIVAGAATADFDRALDSLAVLAATEASIVLPGHGDPWREGIVGAVAAARRAGVA